MTTVLTNSPIMLVLTTWLICHQVSAAVHEVNQQTLKKFLTGKMITMVFVDSPTCSRCRPLYPYYVTASQVFPTDPDIQFSRTHDRQLVEQWGIVELPALVYHREGIQGFHVLKDLDVTVDDIVDTIARLLHGEFGGLKRTYALRVDEKNYDELIVTPRQNVLLLIHDKKDSKERQNLEKVAYAFRNDEAILLATLDVTKYERLRDDRFMTRTTPTLMWFDAKEKNTPKRFGGILSAQLITMFINEKTSLQRNHDGTLLKDAGRVPQLDAIIEDNIEIIYSAQTDSLVILSTKLEAHRKKIDAHQLHLLDYYLYVLDNIGAVNDVSVLGDLFKEEEDTIYGKEELSPKTKEVQKRKLNILNYFMTALRQMQHRPKAESKEKIESKPTEFLDKNADVSHSHFHSEL